MAFTAVERGKKARMAPLAWHSTEEIAVFIRQWIDRYAISSTDELPGNLAIGRAQAGHIRVNHCAEDFARNDERAGAHVNTAESLKCHSQASHHGRLALDQRQAAISPRRCFIVTAAMVLRIAWQHYSALNNGPLALKELLA